MMNVPSRWVRAGAGIILLWLTTACGVLALVESWNISLVATAISTPHSTEAAAVCPVTLPQDLHISDPFMAGLNVSNADGTLLTNVWPESKVIFEPGGAGEIGTDGSLSMKWPWFRHNIKGQVVIEGRRLDAFAPPLRSTVGCCYGNNTASPDCCYGDTGFTPSALIFTSEGCWEVTARVNEHQVTFVTLVIRLKR